MLSITRHLFKLLKVFPCIANVNLCGSWCYRKQNCTLTDSCYSLSCKTVNTRENFWNVYFFVTNQTRDETATDNRQAAAWSSHALTRDLTRKTTSWLFLPRQVFMFTVIKCLTCSFSISAYALANRYERIFFGKAMLSRTVRIRHS